MHSMIRSDSTDITQPQTVVSEECRTHKNLAKLPHWKLPHYSRPAHTWYYVLASSRCVEAETPGTKRYVGDSYGVVYQGLGAEVVLHILYESYMCKPGE